MSRLSTRQSRIIAATLPTVVVAGGVLLLATDSSSVGPVEVVVTLAALQATSWFASIWMHRKGETDVWQPMAALLAAGLLLLPPSGVTAAFAVGTFAGFVAGRARPFVVAFNTAQTTVTVALAAWTYYLLADGSGLGARKIVAVSVAVGVDALANEAVVSAYHRFVDGAPFASSIITGMRFSANRVPIAAAFGIVAGMAGHSSEWAALVAIPPLAGFQFVLAEHLRARVDREHFQGLLEAANSAHASVRTEEVTAAITAAAAQLLRCGEARIVDTEPAQEGVWSARLTGELSDRWLVVSERTTGEPLEAGDQGLLAALAAIGASALENARLVEEIQHRAVHDPLTGLANQVLFEDRVSQAITASRRNRERFAVMVLDLDAFKKINDSLGHSQGNELLRLMADRLAGSIRDIDTVARLGSDHFTLLLPGIGDADQAAVMCEKLLGAIRRPVSLGGHELFMTASAGLAFFPEDGTRAEHLLRNADGAMHRAKEMGRDTFQVYASGMNEAAHMRLVRESELHLALQRDELRLRYQPQIDLRTGRIVGVEALVRWDHPVLGLIGPHEFVPLAEESGLIVAVDTWVMQRACQQATTWLDSGLPPVTMAVNLSGRHFQASERLLDTVQLALLESGLDPRSLELEVTEGIAVGEEQGTGRLLQQVRELGVRIAIDDFGTGYSMLGRLQKFPIDKLKIDRSFVMEIETAHGEAPIVAAMIAMARSLKIEVVAEGVETLEQQTFLRFHGCDQAQGFLFSHPVEAHEIDRLLSTPSLGFNVTAAS